LISYDSVYHTFPITISKGSDSTPLNTTLSYTGCNAAAPPALGLPCSVTEPGGQVTSFQYDAFGRATNVSKPSTGYLETRIYLLPDAQNPGRTIAETHLVRASGDLVYKTYTDGLGRTFREESPGKQTETVQIDRTYDSRGRVASETLPYVGTIPAATT